MSWHETVAHATNGLDEVSAELGGHGEDLLVAVAVADPGGHAPAGLAQASRGGVHERAGVGALANRQDGGAGGVFADQFLRECVAVLIRLAWFAGGIASVEEIDRLNIYHATHLAMRRAIAVRISA